jgi:LysM repeat protein
MPGDWSNIKSASTKSLYTSTSKVDSVINSFKESITPEKTIDIISQELTPKPSSLCVYKVQPGDSLWSLAEQKLGDGKKYPEIKELNKLTNNTITPNQEINLPCDHTEEALVQAKEELNQEGLKLSVLVKDKNNHPISGASVTIHSKVQTAITDVQGVAHFENVEPGDHKVILAYQEYKGEQDLNLDGSVKELNLTLQIQVNSGFSSPQVRGVLIVLGCIISILTISFLFLLTKLAHR